MSKVFVAMSGGVDSSVAAALLVERGEEVVGNFLWPTHGPTMAHLRPNFFNYFQTL